MKKSYEYDVVIVGCGVAGLYSALNLSANLNIAIVSKGDLSECDSYLAQGGICVLKDKSDYESFFEDTLKAGHFENSKSSVSQMIMESRDVIKSLIAIGVEFNKDDAGNLAFTKEGAHAINRILFHDDITGKEITTKLLCAVQKLPNVTFFENTTMIDIIESKNECKGIVCYKFASNSQSKADGEYYCKNNLSSKNIYDGKEFFAIKAKETILATGGIGGLFEHSTNYDILTGDSLAICKNHNVELMNVDYIQIHPTTFYSEKKGRSFLISESVRGEGGILLDSNGKRFVNELLPRDVVSNAIFKKMKEEGSKHVWLSMENIPEEVIRTHFAHIYEHCLDMGYDCTKEPIPVVPAQHYFMGGVKVDLYGKTSMKSLFAVGETCCNNVHGKNRLASNSLLESLVWAKKAAFYINDIKKVYSNSISLYKNNKSKEILDNSLFENIDFNIYLDTDKLFFNYKKIIMDEIERMKKEHDKRNKVQHSTDNNDASDGFSDSFSA